MNNKKGIILWVWVFLIIVMILIYFFMIKPVIHKSKCQKSGGVWQQVCNEGCSPFYCQCPAEWVTLKDGNSCRIKTSQDDAKCRAKGGTPYYNFATCQIGNNMVSYGEL